MNERDTNPDSQVMDQILKGDSFPEDFPGVFLDDSIRAFFDDLLRAKSISKSAVIRSANIPRTYGYQILGGTRIAHRDYYLRIAIAMGLDLHTTQRLLAITRSGGLHPLIKRDAAVIFALNHRYDIIQTYDFMLKLDLQPLEKDENNRTD